MTTIEVINQTVFDEKFSDKIGTLLFPSEWYDCIEYVDKSLLRNNIKELLPKGSRIIKVLIQVDSSPNFKNVANRKIPYKTALCADQNQDGAYYKTYPGMNFAMWASDYPVGDAIVVYK